MLRVPPGSGVALGVAVVVVVAVGVVPGAEIGVAGCDAGAAPLSTIGK